MTSLEEKKKKLLALRKLKKEGSSNIKIKETINIKKLDDDIKKKDNIALDIIYLNNIFTFKSVDSNDNDKNMKCNKEVQTNFVKSKSKIIQDPMQRMIRNTIVNIKNKHDSSNIIFDQSDKIDNNKLEEYNDISTKKSYHYFNKNEYNSISLNDNFENFVNSSSKYIEKIFNLTNQNKIPVHSESDYISYNQRKEKFKNSFVNCLEWSPLIDNLYLSVYSYKENTLKNLKNINSYCYIWNLDFDNPEFKFKSEVEITKCMFDKYNGDLVISGLSNSGIEIFDSRAGSLSILKSRNSTDIGSTPIVGLDFVGSANTGNLITINEEGKLCYWDLNDLSKPIKVNQFKFKSKSIKEIPIYPKCMSINYNTSNIYIGTCDNSIKELSIHKENNEVLENCYIGHNGPITSIKHFNYKKSMLLKNLMISTSMDWEINIWNTYDSNINMPIHTFDIHKDYVTSIDINPYNPGILSSADAQGNYYFWNLFSDLKSPYKAFKTKTSSAIFETKFNFKGNLIAISDLEGNIEIQKLNNEELEFSENKVKMLEEYFKYQTNIKKEELEEIDDLI